MMLMEHVILLKMRKYPLKTTSESLLETYCTVQSCVLRTTDALHSKQSPSLATVD